MAIKEPDRLIEAARADKDRQFRRLYDEAIEEARRRFQKGDYQYNRGGVHITDYGDALEDSIKTRFPFVWENALRLKSEINSGGKPKGKAIDLINYTAFLYVAARMQE